MLADKNFECRSRSMGTTGTGTLTITLNGYTETTAAALEAEFRNGTAKLNPPAVNGVGNFDRMGKDGPTQKAPRTGYGRYYVPAGTQTDIVVTSVSEMPKPPRDSKASETPESSK